MSSQGYRVTGEITIRVADLRDAEAVAAIYAPIVRDTAISFETEPPSPEEMAARIEATLPTHPWLVAERDDAVLGYAHASRHAERGAYRWSVNVTAYLTETARGKGLGRRLYGMLIPILQAQGFRSAFAGIALPNDASVGLHEAVGFRPLGVYQNVGFKLGTWRDVGWWRRSLNDADGPPAEPIAFAALGLSPWGTGRPGGLLRSL
jgi:L-amino acid N-acyltransferase YncA